MEALFEVTDRNGGARMVYRSVPSFAQAALLEEELQGALAKHNGKATVKLVGVFDSIQSASSDDELYELCAG